MFSASAAMKRCTPNVAASPAASVVADAASTTRPQAPPPSANPTAVNAAPASAKTARRDAFAWSGPLREPVRSARPCSNPTLNQSPLSTPSTRTRGGSPTNRCS